MTLSVAHRVMAEPTPPHVGTHPVEVVVARLRAGGSAVLSGPAGVGKSHTLRAVADRLRADGIAVLGIRATASLAAVPLGALLPLLAQAEPSGLRTRTDTALALLRILQAPGRPVLLVDDAHLLDAASAGILHQALGAGVPVAVAVRVGERAPDAVARLVPDLGAANVPVPRLTEEQTAVVLSELLGGAVDDRMVDVVHRRAAGLPLAVQAIARAALDSGDAVLARGEWRLRGAIPVVGELAALMRGSTSRLDDGALRAAELVALGEGLAEAQLRALGAQQDAERAERAGVLAVGRSGVVTLAHPLLHDALLAELPVLRRRRRLAELLDASVDAPGAVARLHRADWSLELGRRVDPAELLALVDVTASDDPDRAERYARAAIAAGGGPVARLRLADVLAHLHRRDDAEGVLSEIDPSGLDPATAASVVLTRAFMLVFTLGRPAAALEELASMPDMPMVMALRSSAHLFASEFARAEREAAVLAVRQELPIEVRAHAALTRASALAWDVRTGDLATWLPIARPLVDAAATAIPEGAVALRLVEGAYAVRACVDPDRAEALATAGHRVALLHGEDGERAQWAHQLGEAALLRGRAEEALDLLLRAVRGRGRWAATNEGMVRGALVRALVLTGRRAEALAELEDLRTVHTPPHFATDVALADAEVEAGGRDLRRAGRIAESAARTDPSGGADAWYAAMRFGRAGAAASFLAASTQHPGAGRAAQRVHAEALVAHDPAALEAASGALDLAGLGWFAVDAMAHAVLAAARLDPGDVAPRERLALLAARFPTLRSPIVAAIDGPILTEREAQVARLLTGGATARAIAERLGIGVRTVETHVAHIYRKLGVGTKEELRRVLRAG